MMVSIPSRELNSLTSSMVKSTLSLTVRFIFQFPAIMGFDIFCTRSVIINTQNINMSMMAWDNPVSDSMGRFNDVSALDSLY